MNGCKQPEIQAWMRARGRPSVVHAFIRDSNVRETASARESSLTGGPCESGFGQSWARELEIGSDGETPSPVPTGLGELGRFNDSCSRHTPIKVSEEPEKLEGPKGPARPVE